MTRLRHLIESAVRDVVVLLHKAQVPSAAIAKARARLVALLVSAAELDDVIASDIVEPDPGVICRELAYELADCAAASIAPMRAADRLQAECERQRTDLSAMAALVERLTTRAEVAEAVVQRVHKAHNISLDAYFREVLLLRRRNLAAGESLQHVNNEMVFDYRRYLSALLDGAQDSTSQYMALQEEHRATVVRMEELQASLAAVERDVANVVKRANEAADDRVRSMAAAMRAMKSATVATLAAMRKEHADMRAAVSGMKAVFAQDASVTADAVGTVTLSNTILGDFMLRACQFIAGLSDEGAAAARALEMRDAKAREAFDDAKAQREKYARLYGKRAAAKMGLDRFTPPSSLISGAELRRLLPSLADEFTDVARGDFQQALLIDPVADSGAVRSAKLMWRQSDVAVAVVDAVMSCRRLRLQERQTRALVADWAASTTRHGDFRDVTAAFAADGKADSTAVASSADHTLTEMLSSIPAAAQPNALQQLLEAAAGGGVSPIDAAAIHAAVERSNGIRRKRCRLRFAAVVWRRRMEALITRYTQEMEWWGRKAAQHRRAEEDPMWQYIVAAAPRVCRESVAGGDDAAVRQISAEGVLRLRTAMEDRLRGLRELGQLLAREDLVGRAALFKRLAPDTLRAADVGPQAMRGRRSVKSKFQSAVRCIGAAHRWKSLTVQRRSQTTLPEEISANDGAAPHGRPTPRRASLPHELLAATAHVAAKASEADQHRRVAAPVGTATGPSAREAPVPVNALHLPRKKGPKHLQEGRLRAAGGDAEKDLHSLVGADAQQGPTSLPSSDRPSTATGAVTRPPSDRAAASTPAKRQLNAPSPHASPSSTPHRPPTAPAGPVRPAVHQQTEGRAGGGAKRDVSAADHVPLREGFVSHTRGPMAPRRVNALHPALLEVLDGLPEGANLDATIPAARASPRPAAGQQSARMTSPVCPPPEQLFIVGGINDSRGASPAAQGARGASPFAMSTAAMRQGVRWYGGQEGLEGIWATADLAAPAPTQRPQLPVESTPRGHSPSRSGTPRRRPHSASSPPPALSMAAPPQLEGVPAARPQGTPSDHDYPSVFPHDESDASRGAPLGPGPAVGRRFSAAADPVVESRRPSSGRSIGGTSIVLVEDRSQGVPTFGGDGVRAARLDPPQAILVPTTAGLDSRAIRDQSVILLATSALRRGSTPLEGPLDASRPPSRGCLVRPPTAPTRASTSTGAVVVGPDVLSPRAAHHAAELHAACLAVMDAPRPPEAGPASMTEANAAATVLPPDPVLAEPAKPFPTAEPPRPPQEPDKRAQKGYGKAPFRPGKHTPKT